MNYSLVKISLDALSEVLENNYQIHSIFTLKQHNTIIAVNMKLIQIFEPLKYLNDLTRLPFPS